MRKVNCHVCGGPVEQQMMNEDVMSTGECVVCHPPKRRDLASGLVITDVTLPCPECGKDVQLVQFGDTPPRAETCCDCIAECKRKEEAEEQERLRKEREEAEKKRLEAVKARHLEVTDRDGQISLGIPPKYHGAAFADCDGSRMLGAWLAQSEEGLMTLTGPAGSGKTRALYAVMRHLRAEQDPDEYGKPWLKYRVPELAKHLQALGREPSIEEAEIKNLSGFEGMLLLDDLGVEKVTPFVLQDLYMILAEREEWDRPTLMTTNLTLDQVAAQFDDRIASRLAGGHVIYFGGEDRRVSGQQQESTP